MSQRKPSASVPQLSLDQHKVTFTFFRNQQAKKKWQDDLTLPEIADEIQRTDDVAKEQLWWLKMAIFGDKPSKNKCLRHDANVEWITGVEVDYDAGKITFEEGAARLREAGLRALIYTSPSYQKGVKEKWRVLCPLSMPNPPDNRAPLVAVLNGVLGGGVDGASFTLSQAFYYGSVGGNPDHRVEVLDGEFIDNRMDLAPRAIGKPASTRMDKTPPAAGVVSSIHESPSYSEEELEALLQATQYKRPGGEGQWHNNMLSFTGSLISRGAGDTEIYTRTAPLSDGGYMDPHVVEMVDSARAKWGIPDPDIPKSALLGADVLAAIDRDAPPRLVEPDWRERYAETGYPKASLHNARLAIEALGIQCSEDTFHNELYIGRDSAAPPDAPKLPFFGLVTDSGIGALRMCLSDTWGLDFTEKHVRDAVNILCHENSFDPVVDMLADAEANWDGKPRLDRMAVDHFNAADTDLNRLMVRKTMIAAVARARQPGCKFDTVLVMESPEGWNKSSAWALLAGEGNFSDQSILGSAGREVQEQLAGIWIHENAELAGMRKTEIETVKAFASRQVDMARPAYGHYLKKQPRHSIEVATTNDDRYLLSMTGNRRFWPLEVLSMIDLQKLRAARLQLWGEAAHYQSHGEYLTLPEGLWAAAGAVQESKRVEHPWEAKLAALSVVPDNDPTGGWGNRGLDVIHVVGTEQRVASADLFDRVLGIPAGQLNNGHAKTVASIMRRLGWRHGVFERDGKTTKGYRRT